MDVEHGWMSMENELDGFEGRREKRLLYYHLYVEMNLGEKARDTNLLNAVVIKDG